MVDLSFKKPIGDSLKRIANSRSNSFQQAMAKGIPCHVTKVNKDIVTVAFEPSNGIWSMPTMEMPQAFSPYSREPTQVGDKGSAVPADYYLGGVSGLGGGQTTFAPKGNVTPLVFQPLSKTSNETRDYNQLSLFGGPNGVKIRQKATPQQQTSTPTPTPKPSMRALRGLGSAGRRAWQTRAPRAPRNGTTPTPTPTPMSEIQIDKNGLISHTSADGNHFVQVDQQNRKVAIKVPASGSDNVWLGGSGKQSSLYGKVMVMTPSGLAPSVNVMAKYQQQDD
jgi:hypothetical protein